MTAVALPVLVLGVTVGSAYMPILRRLLRSSQPAEITPEWLENFSVASYKSMDGLLNGQDFEFLSRQPGFDLSLYRKLRRERIQIFHLYLHKMVADFNRLHLAARLMVAQSSEDQSEFLKDLVQLKLRFSLSVLQAECNYYLCKAGLRSLPARHLIVHLEQLAGVITSRAAAVHAAQPA